MLLERLKLESEEQVIAYIRKHWWIITAQTLGLVLAAVLPAVALKFLASINLDNTFDLTRLLDNYAWEITYGYLAWLLMLWIGLANVWTDYYLDLWIITNRRVMLIDQRGFFNRRVSSFRLERLQDMNIAVTGILATLLDYGTVEAETAGGDEDEFVGRYLPKPRDIKAMVVRAADELNAKQRAMIDELKAQGI